MTECDTPKDKIEQREMAEKRGGRRVKRDEQET